MLTLLDLDGTLIHDRGYRAAIDATVIRYAQKHQLPIYPPYDDDVNLLHAYGYSNEWDTVAFLAGISHYLHTTGGISRPDYQSWTRQTSEFRGLPNERARSVLLHVSPENLHPVIHLLLDNVTSVEQSPTTRMFAEMILGSELFSQHYGLEPELNTASLLEELDEPLIDQQGRDIILAQRACIFTARPSLPPGHQLTHPSVSPSGNWTFTRPDSEDYAPVHPPEAEIGLRLLHLDHLPMIALGHIQWLADQHDERVYDLTKPSPVQAMAAMLAAAGVAERRALTAAYKFWKDAELPDEFMSVNNEDVFVLEDNAGGIRSCIAAAELLQQHGVRVKVHGYGISAAPAKRAVLEPVCEMLATDVNQALREIDRLRLLG